MLIERLNSGDLQLPMLPDTAAAVLDACRSENSGVRQIADLMQRDPALAAHVLRTANSAAYGASHPIVSLAQAVSRLGLTLVGEITLAAIMKGRIFRVPGYDSEVRAVWLHSVAAAAWAREIARLRRQSVEGAFLCGLLHDVGRPVLLQEVLDLWPNLENPPNPIEITALVDELHATVGAALVKRWSLPQWMSTAIAWHHNYRSAPEHADEVMTTVLADQLAHWSLEDDVDTESLKGSLVIGELNLYPEEFVELLTEREHVLAIAMALE